MFEKKKREIRKTEKSEHKRLEKELQESEKRLKILFEFAPDGYYLSNLKGNFIDGNKAAEEIVGYKREELIGKNFLKLKLLPLHQIPKAAMLLRKNILGQPTGPDEFILNRKDGSQILVEIKTFPVKIKNQSLVLGIVRDITERKRLEEERARATAARERAAIIDAMPDSLVVLNLDGVITFVNPAFTKTLGHTPEERIGKSFDEFGESIKAEDIEKFMKLLGELMETGHVEPVETVLRTKDGKELPISVVYSLIKDAKGNPKNIIATLRDITELKRLEEERVRSEKLAVVGQLAAGVAHELRSPLWAIKNAIYYLTRKVGESKLARENPQIAKFLQIADKEIDSSNRIIGDLLDFTRIPKPLLERAQINEVIEDALALTELPPKIKLIKKLDSELPLIPIDKGQLRQVFSNIIRNALEVMPKEGELRIKSKKKEKSILVEFADTGQGIPKEVIGKIFDPLFTNKAKGVGLGLAICEQIIKAHKGEIKVKSEEGKGATFTIILPIVGK